MTTATPPTAHSALPAEIVVAMPDACDPATLSCRLHGVINGLGDEAERSSTRSPGDEAERSSTRSLGDEAERSSTRRPGDGAERTIVVEVGGRAADPDVARVLACARAGAASRGLGFVVR